MPTIVDCPSCNRKLRVPDELLGRNVKCPTCSTTFQANASSAPQATVPAPAPAPPPPQATPRPAPPPRSASSSSVPLAQKRCAYCGELVAADAQRCDHCGEALAGDDRPWEQYSDAVRRDCEPHRGGMILTMGIISVCLAPIGLVPPCCYINIVFSGIGLGLGIPAIVMGKRDLDKMTQGVMDPQGQGLTQAGWICGIVGTVLNTLAMLAWVAMAVMIAVAIISGA